jgi:lysyl-tRNA synthetase class 1
MEVVRAHEKYRAGFFVPAIEQALAKTEAIRTILEDISGRKLDEQWSPVQVVEDGFLKNRQFISIDTNSKTIQYVDKEGEQATADYSAGNVKLSWRIDWPARWSLLHVNAEPFGRDHATKGGSYDTGKVIVRDIFRAEAPYPLPYNFIMRSGETKKMSKSAGDVITAADLLNILPPEIVWFFLLRYAPDKQLFFDEGDTLLRLFDEFAELSAKPDKTDSEQQLLDLCLHRVHEPTVSNVPFSHLVASYQAALRNLETTLAVIARTEHADTAGRQGEIIVRELRFIDNWLDQWAPDDIKFSLQANVASESFSEQERSFFAQLADKISAAPIGADGAWFHDAIYEFKDGSGLAPKELFQALYRLTIGKTSGPRAGWFLSILPRDWLIARLKLEK